MFVEQVKSFDRALQKPNIKGNSMKYTLNYVKLNILKWQCINFGTVKSIWLLESIVYIKNYYVLIEFLMDFKSNLLCYKYVNFN